MDGLGKGVVVFEEHVGAALDERLEVAAHMVGHKKLPIKHCICFLLV